MDIKVTFSVEYNNEEVLVEHVFTDTHKLSVLCMRFYCLTLHHAPCTCKLYLDMPHERILRDLQRYITHKVSFMDMINTEHALLKKQQLL